MHIIRKPRTMFEISIVALKFDGPRRPLLLREIRFCMSLRVNRVECIWNTYFYWLTSEATPHDIQILGKLERL